MILAAFISQLRANAPMFGGRVAGAAEFQNGLRNYNTSLPLPAAYVVPLIQDAEPNLSYGGLQQIVHMGIGVAVELDAQTDRRGQAPAMDIDTVRAQVFASVLNYRIDDCHMARGASYAGSRPLEVLDRARWFYQFEFNIDWQITEADGFQPIADDLIGVEVDIFGPHGVPPAGTMPAAVVMVATADPDNPIPPTNGPWPSLQRMLERLGLK